MKSFIPDKLYDFLKWIAMIVIDAVAVFVKAVFPVWGIPYSDEISTTLVSIGALLGAILGVSAIQYNKNKEN
jgi:hypothetical protein